MNLVILTTVALVIYIAIATATMSASWSTKKTSAGNITLTSESGVWTTCTEVSPEGAMPGLANKCYNSVDKMFGKAPQILYTERILTGISLGLFTLAITLLLFSVNPKVITALVALGSLFALVSSIVWATSKKMKPQGTKFGFSWYLELIGTVFFTLVQFNVIK